MAFKGLRNFIADIRATITYEDECKIIEEEKTKIRQNFASPDSDSYDRRKYCLKLMYMHVLGHSVDFGMLQASQLMASKTREEKLVGYLTLGELLQDSKDFLRLVTQTVMYDLQQINEFSTPLALTFVANTANKEMAEVVAPQIMQILIASKHNSAVTTYIKKKAALALLHCFRVNPESVDTEPIRNNLIDLLDAHNVGFLNCMVHLLAGISERTPELFEATKTKAIYLLGKIVLKKEVSADHQYYSCPCPWLIIGLMRFLRRLSSTLEDVNDPANGIIRQQETIDAVIRECFRMTSSLHASANVDMQNIFWALAHEAGLLANFYSDYFEEKIDADFMVKAIVSKDSKPNVRFAAMNTLASMSRMVSVNISIRMNIVAIVETISKEMDFSLRGKGQVLLFNSADAETAEGVVACLLGGARATRFPIEYREDSLLRSAILCERHGLYTNVEEDGADVVRSTIWTIRSMISLLPTATDLALRFVWQNLANSIMMKIGGIEDMQLKADVLFEILGACFIKDSITAAQNAADPSQLQIIDDPMILTVASYIITESIFESFSSGFAGIFYGIAETDAYKTYSVVFGNEAVFSIVSQAIIMLQNSNFKEEVPVAVSAMIALCYIGICPMQNLQLLTVSPIPEVQQRAIEAYAIMQLTDREMVANLLQQTPVLTEVRGLESRIRKDGEERKKPAAEEEAPVEEAPAEETQAAPAQDQQQVSPAPAAIPGMMDMFGDMAAPQGQPQAPAPAAPAAPAPAPLDDLLSF